MKSWLKHPVFWGVVATVAVVGFALCLGFSQECTALGSCKSRFAIFWESKPNEIGDTLAGFAGALAFVWIIVTVWLQSIELAAQREELKLTRQELQGQREASEEMAKAMEAQAAIFEDEKLRRDQAEAAKVLDQKLGSLKNAIVAGHGLNWEPADHGNFAIIASEGLSFFTTIKPVRELEPDEFFWRQYLNATETVSELKNHENVGGLSNFPSAKNLTEFIGTFRTIISLQDRLSEDQIERLGRIGIFGLNALIKEIQNMSIWSDIEERTQ